MTYFAAESRTAGLALRTDGMKAAKNNQNTYDMNSLLKYLGVILVILGAVVLVLGALVPAMSELLDYNGYTATGMALIVVGLLAHIFLNKYLPLTEE